ncbi:hypothetical protein [Saccharothrix sp. NRRL B-16314]|uniref:hypothetical protein n=1 Tax=Saccharothrix sp. NRRL B-16314 TaxID=1463825 RepID=UPI000524E983|nr:hypothetical protein [Saccharothrix sp. NRRL B-16314]
MDVPDREFDGDLFLRLVDDGTLVLEPADADRVIAKLERALAAVTGRLRLVDLLHGASLADLHRVHPDVERAVVDAVFHEQVTGGRLRRAVDELPRYIRALEQAKKSDGCGRR